MDVQAYIESGIIQDYCLGLLGKEEIAQVEQYAAEYSAIREEIRSYQQALEQYAMDFVRVVPEDFKTKTLDLLDDLAREENGLINDLPLLTSYSSHENWLRVIKPLLPATLNEDMFARVLRDDEKVFQTALWIRTDYPEEVHDDLQESFLILEGTCECYIGEELLQLGPGGYVEIPCNVSHNVKLISGPVLAIVQRLKSA
jgi:mannose-6-phosphate isomerase-like protein (cupin superfamily)